MAKVLMVQGTMSGVGKSFIVAGILRIFKQDGYRVAPFKSQNMALNSFITEEGLEMGRAQVMQAEAAGIRPMVCMNPILLKPTDNVGSQVIVNGEVLGNMSATEFFAYKKKLVPDIKRAFQTLSENMDIIVIEGAGSPAEINLKENDIVNMGMAEMVDSNVLLVGDIDRGGVFAQLLGTQLLLEPSEKERVKGLIINKFRGDKSLLDSGIQMLEEKSGVKVCGVVPYMDVKLEDEDSLSERFSNRTFDQEKLIDIVVIRFPKISNFTDFNVFEQCPEVSVRYVTDAETLGNPDLLILPGSKNTIADYRWFCESGLKEAVKNLANENVPVFGICGGFQMLGEDISDPECVESGGMTEALGLLPVHTILKEHKIRKQKKGILNPVDGIFSALSGLAFEGYEIHMGETVESNEFRISDSLENGAVQMREALGNSEEGMNKNSSLVVRQNGNVYGTYIHGIFDKKEIAEAVIHALAAKKGLNSFTVSFEDYRDYKEREYDRMADILREYLDMDAIYAMLNEAKFSDEAISKNADQNVKKAIKARFDNVAKPIDGMGKFETVLSQIGAIQGKTDFTIEKKAVLVFCADNGIVEEGVSQSTSEVTVRVINNMLRGKSSVAVMAKKIGADLHIVDVGVDCDSKDIFSDGDDFAGKEEIIKKMKDNASDSGYKEWRPNYYDCKIRRGSRNFAKEPALTEEELNQAIRCGMNFVGKLKKNGYQIIALGEMGIGNTTTSSAVCAALTGLEVEKLVGRGAGLNDAGLAKKREVISKALIRYRLRHEEVQNSSEKIENSDNDVSNYSKTALAALQQVGGYDLAALTGAFIGGAVYHIPIVADGVITMTAALAASRIVPGCLEACILSHKGKEPAVAILEEELMKSGVACGSVIDASMALGEGTGAVMMLSLADLAMEVYENAARFDDLSMEQYTRFQ